MSRENVQWSVGRRAPDDSSRISIKGAAFSSPKPKGTILITPGITSCWRDYEEFAGSLASEFDVVAYSLRGHGSSQGYFHPRLATYDLEAIAEQLGNVGLVGHSIGCGISARASENEKVRGIYMLCPFLSQFLLPGKQQKTLSRIGKACRIPGPADLIDAVIHYSGIGWLRGFNNKRVLRDFSNMRKIGICEVGKPLAYAVPDNDSMLGTIDTKYYKGFRKQLGKVYKFALDYSDLVKGLNHCLNIEGYRPFCKREEEKGRDKLIESISGFFSDVLDNS